MSKKRQKRKRRSKSRSGGGGGGTLMGMRRGFKNVASSVSGNQPKKKKKSSWVSWAVTIVVVAGAVAFFLSNR